MKTVPICGSMRFEKEMWSIAFELKAKHGMSVLQCVCPLEGHEVNEGVREALTSEIRCAKTIGKAVRFHSKEGRT